MLAQGALDRALTESCTVALEMVDEVKSLPKGPVASFNAGMAAALCGDQPYAENTIAALQQSYPQNTAVAQYYVPQLQAAAEIGVNEPEKALDSLIALEQYDRDIACTVSARDGECGAGADAGGDSGFSDCAGSPRLGDVVERECLSYGGDGDGAGVCGQSR